MSYQDAKQKFTEKIEANFEASKKKKPQSMDSSGLTKIKDRPIVLAKDLKLPPGDPKSVKINGISWGVGGMTGKIAFARQDHFLGVMDAEKNCGYLGGKAPWAQCIALHPSKDFVLSGGMDNATTMWNGVDGKLIEKGKIIEHDGYISSLLFVEGGSKYLSSAGDADTRLIDIEKKTAVTRFVGHEKDAQSISVAKTDLEQQVFATCSSDKTVKIWDRRVQNKYVGDLDTATDGGGGSELNSCAMFPTGQMVAAGGEKDKTYLFDVRAMRLLSTYARNNMKTASLEFSTSGRHLYVGHDDGAIIMWDIFSSGANKEYACKIPAHTFTEKGSSVPDVGKSRVQNLKVGPDGVLASCGFDGKVKIWTGVAAG